MKILNMIMCEMQRDFPYMHINAPHSKIRGAPLYIQGGSLGRALLFIFTPQPGYFYLFFAPPKAANFFFFFFPSTKAAKVFFCISMYFLQLS